MSATELTEQPQEPLPESPVQVLVEATTVPDAVAVINIEEVRSNSLAAETMESTSVEAANKAGEYFSAQTSSEVAADRSYAGAATADSETVYNSHTGQAETHTAQAESYNTMGHSTAAVSEEASAKSAALEMISHVQQAGIEIAERTELAIVEQADRTAEGVKQEMKVIAAAAEDAASSNNLEGEMKMAAMEASAPKA